MRCFIDSTTSAKKFSYTPSVGYEIRMMNWGLEDERRYFQNLIHVREGQPTIEFIQTMPANITPSSMEYTMDYILNYPHHQNGISKGVRGFMHLYLGTDNQQRWLIYKWEDVKTSTDSTWSYLKYSFD